MKDMTDKEKAVVDQILSEFQCMREDRYTFESHWEEVAELVAPDYAGYFLNQAYRTPGEKRTQRQYDATAMVARGRFSSVMDSMITPRNQRWHRLRHPDRNVMKDRNAALYYEELTNLLFQYRYSPMANFANNNNMNFDMQGTFGTGTMFVDAMDTGGIRYRSIHVAELYFSENHHGVIDKAVRRFPMSARQLVGMFGMERMPSRVKNALDKAADRQDIFVLHCVKPRDDYKHGNLDMKGKRFASYYVLEDERVFLREGGYRMFPYSIGRNKTAPGEVYGRSPAMDVLAAIKTLNEEKKTIIKQGHRTVDPVLLTHDDGIINSFSLRPGALNAGGVNASGQALVQALPVGNLAVGKELMDDERQVINDVFLVTIFQILVESPQMTATEVLEKTREKGILIGPQMGRQLSEYVAPMVYREIDVLASQGRLPPMPDIVREAGGQYEIMYDSPLSRAQRAEEASGLSRTLEITLNAVNITQDMSPVDNFDFDVIVPDLAEINAVPRRWMRSEEDKQKIREGRAQAQQQQQLVDAAPALASLAGKQA